ncbi:hypothetical protein LTR46_002613 [Exophiala xenobiotica]|nr:hypothetical protein LTR46_002613 [Exophiala xenobiotica]
MARRGRSASQSNFEYNDTFETLPLRPIYQPSPTSAADPLLTQQHDSQETKSASQITATGSLRSGNHPRASWPARPQYLPLQDADIVDGTSPHSPQPSSRTLKHSIAPLWKPMFLRWPFLLSTLVIALLLGLVVILLLAVSASHDGLGADDGSSTILFGWRFAPTLVTVLYTILTAMSYNDAQRTEPFAQMAHASGASSASSILKSRTPWWFVLSNSLKRRNNHGNVNFFLLSITLVNIIGFLLINPLSSALLQSQPIDLITQTSFSRYQVDENAPISLVSDDLVYFRTIGNILQNLTTSAWLTDKYAVVPFWPSSESANPGITLTNSNQHWEVNSTVLSVDFECEAMATRTTTSGDGALILTDSNGCETAIGVCGQGVASLGGGSWFAPPNFTLTVWDSDADASSGKCYNSTAQCSNRQIILATNSTWEFDPKNDYSQWFHASAWSCETNFYRADIPVSVSTGTSGTSLDVDDSVFHAHRSLLQPIVFNQARFEGAFLNQNWTSVIYTTQPSQSPNFGGVSALLGALYDFTPAAMLGANSVVEHAQRIKQRFLGEMALNTITNNSPITQSGSITNTERRVVVNLPVAIALAILFTISAGLTGLALWTSSRRSLNLHNDPASVAAVIKLTNTNTMLRDSLKTQWPVQSPESDTNLRASRHFLQDGAISSAKSDVLDTEDVNSKVERRSNWKPFALRLYAGLLLLLFLALVFAAILTLFILAYTVGLYESAFTYQTNLVPSKSSLFTFAPYSIVPTFLAVVIGLWWDDLDETFRRLQPYVTMAQKAVPISPIVGLSYLPSYSIGSVAKALRNRHEYVALVSAAAVLVQVLTVSMSALWQRADGSRPGDMALIRSLEPRTQPLVYTLAGSTAMGSGDLTGQAIISSFYGDLSTNWLYSATLQLAYNGSQPPWSRDGWSFVPVDLSSVVDSAMYKNTPSTNNSDPNSASSAKTVNVTVTTPALRGKLTCSAAGQVSNLSSWTTQWDLTNRMVWNVTKNPAELHNGYEVNGNFELGAIADLSTTPILARDHTLLCCRNASSVEANSGASALGYWSNNYAENQVYDFDDADITYPRNLTMKWIRGTTASQLYLMNETYEGYYHGEYDDFRHLIWTEAPQMAALNCQPRIEWTNASVTVDMATGRVYTYKIEDDGDAIQILEHAWSDAYLPHDYVAPGDNASTGQFHNQYTVSFGVLFQDAMLFASDLKYFWPAGGGTQSFVEDLDDKNFNFRLEQQGLNTDLMSYSMYQLANGDIDVLMDPTQMEQLGQTVFSTFFQHFVSANVTTEGGWGFQKIGATLPAYLAPLSNGTQPDANTSLTSDTNAHVHVEIAVEVLQMSPVAVYLSLVILLVLMLVTLFVYSVGYRRFRKLRHDFDNLASVVSVICDSERLRAWVNEHPDPETWTERARARGGQVPLVRLGMFMGSDGVERWGIAIVEDAEEDHEQRT